MLHKDLNDIEPREVVPGFYAKFVHSESMTVAYWTITADHTMPEHAHPHEQIFTVLEGTFQLTVGKETLVAKPGSVVVIPPDIQHSGRALTDCRVIDVFYPVRKEYQ
jgi:quercetin dioxygenase-like cupin family protein